MSNFVQLYIFIIEPNSILLRYERIRDAELWYVPTLFWIDDYWHIGCKKLNGSVEVEEAPYKFVWHQK